MYSSHIRIFVFHVGLRGPYGVGHSVQGDFWARLVFCKSNRSVCMFDIFHLTFNFKSKVLHGIFRKKLNINYSKMSRWFWVTRYLKNKLIFWIIILQYWFATKKRSCYQSSVSTFWVCMFLQMWKMVAQSIASVSSPQRETCIRA